MPLRHGAIPPAVISRDREIVIARPAVVAHEALLGEKQDRDVRDKHDHHGYQQRRSGRQAQRTNGGTGERQQHHEDRDLGKVLGSKQVVAAADHASPKMVSIVERGIPVEELLTIGALEPHAGRSFGHVHDRPADLLTPSVANLDPHVIRIA